MSVALRFATFDHKETHKIIVLVPLIAAKVCGQFLQLRE